MKIIKERSTNPKPVRLFLPLFIFCVIVYIFLSKAVFFAVVTSDSMSPTFETGDVVLMQSVDVDAVPDDIIMFTVPSERQLIIHRVDEVNEDAIRTKGDATGKVDNWVVEGNNIEAEVIQIGGNPIVLKGVGWYFIDNPPSNAPISEEMHFTSIMLGTLKNLGLIIFFIAVLVYILLSVRDLRKYEVRTK